jgi:hypothetical protein
MSLGLFSEVARTLVFMNERLQHDFERPVLEVLQLSAVLQALKAFFATLLPPRSEDDEIAWEDGEIEDRDGQH